MTLNEKIMFFAALLAAPLTAFILSLLFTRFSIKLLRQWGFAAEMGQRHIHTNVMPTAGGISMILAWRWEVMLRAATIP